MRKKRKQKRRRREGGENGLGAFEPAVLDRWIGKERWWFVFAVVCC
jgi:hypothetical protein